jgi:hypothetical protein
MVPKNGRAIERFIHEFRGKEWKSGSYRQQTAVNGRTKNIFCEEVGGFEMGKHGFTVMSGQGHKKCSEIGKWCGVGGIARKKF